MMMMTGSSDRTDSSDHRDIHRVRRDIQSAVSSFHCSAKGSFVSRRSFQNYRVVITSTEITMSLPIKFRWKRRITDRYI